MTQQEFEQTFLLLSKTSFSNVLLPKQDCCSNIMDSKQGLWHSLDARQDFCSNILGAKFVSMLFGQTHFPLLLWRVRWEHAQWCLLVCTYLWRYRLKFRWEIPSIYACSCTKKQKRKKELKKCLLRVWTKVWLLIKTSFSSRSKCLNKAKFSLPKCLHQAPKMSEQK